MSKRRVRGTDGRYYVRDDLTHCCCLYDETDKQVTWCAPHAVTRDALESQSCEVTRMDKRTRHLLDRIDDAEGVIRNWEPDKASDYWLKYPESERGKFTALEGQNDVFCYECIHGIPCKLHDEPPFERVSEGLAPISTDELHSHGLYLDDDRPSEEIIRELRKHDTD